MGLNYDRELIRIEDKPRHDPYQQWIDSSRPVKGNFVKSEGDEESFFRNQPIEATLVFERNRLRVLPSLRRIVDHLWKRYALPTKGIVEYGSGAAGFFDAVLRPDYVPHWTQVEVNPKAREENKKRNLDAVLEEGFFGRIDKKELSMVLGLTAWDKTRDFPNAMGQVANALKPEGYFLHIQDARPGLECVRSYLEKTIACEPTHGWSVQVPGQDHKEVFGLLVNGQRRTLPDIFKDAIQQAIKSQTNLDLVVNAYLTVEELMQDDDPKLKTMDLCEVYFLNFYGVFGFEPKTMPAQQRLRKTTVLVTLARKKST